MEAVMDQEKLKALAAELAKDIKSEKDLGALTQQLVKLTVETALNAELDEHLGYEKHSPTGRGSGNSRNGTSKKRVKSQHGEVDIFSYGATISRAATVKTPMSTVGNRRIV